MFGNNSCEVSTIFLGQSHWIEQYPDCGGNLQSPIDIQTVTVAYDSSLTVFELESFSTIPTGAHWELINAGHTGKLTFRPGCW